MYETECAAGEEVRRGIYIAGVFGTKGERGVRETVGGDVRQGRREDGGFRGGEGTGWGGVVVGVVVSWFADGLEGLEP